MTAKAPSKEGNFEMPLPELVIFIFQSWLLQHKTNMLKVQYKQPF